MWLLNLVFFFFYYWRVVALLASAIHQHESATGIHMSPPSWILPTPISHPTPALWDVTQHWVELSASDNKFPLAVYLTYDNIYIRFQAILSIHPTLSFPALCPQVCSLCLCLHSCPANRWAPELCKPTGDLREAPGRKPESSLLN